ncbi:hypothetical protein [Nannocystis pusilla]|uniref:hypothetical protein n=1 Tax=Nannocystis pusilla TaxID=889268 RepID=UPI003DA26504
MEDKAADNHPVREAINDLFQKAKATNHVGPAWDDLNWFFYELVWARKQPSPEDLGQMMALYGKMLAEIDQHKLCVESTPRSPWGLRWTVYLRTQIWEEGRARNLNLALHAVRESFGQLKAALEQVGEEQVLDDLSRGIGSPQNIWAGWTEQKVSTLSTKELIFYEERLSALMSDGCHLPSRIWEDLRKARDAVRMEMAREDRAIEIRRHGWP